MQLSAVSQALSMPDWKKLVRQRLNSLSLTAAAESKLAEELSQHFATSRLTHLTPHEFFGTAFWIGFTMHLAAAEIWINYTRQMARVNVPV